MKKTRLKRSRFQIYNNSNVSHTTLEKVDPEQQSELRAKAAADKAAKAAKSALCALLYTFKLLEVDTRDVRTAFRYDQIDLGSAAVITTLIINRSWLSSTNSQKSTLISHSLFRAGDL